MKKTWEKYDNIVKRALSRENEERTKPLPGNPDLKSLKEWSSAHKKLYDFEKKELGMHKGDNVKKNLGTILGIMSIASFVIAAFLATNMTGNAISDTFGNAIGIGNPIFLIVGFVFGIAWLILRR